jgi:hypothetical protein
MTVVSTLPATAHIAKRGNARPTSAATRMASTEAGRSSSTAMDPLPMSMPMSSMRRMLRETVAASDAAMYQLSATAV